MLTALAALIANPYDWEEASCIKAQTTNTWALAKHCDFGDTIKNEGKEPRVITVHALECE